MREKQIRSFVNAMMVSLFMCLPGFVQSADEKKVEEPKVVDPGNRRTPPSDAIVLFDGSGFDHWKPERGESVAWKLVDDDAMEVAGGKGGIMTRDTFGSFQLHVEWASPAEVKGEGQGRGNSGVYLHGRYEVQVLDSYNNKTYPDGQAGALYTIAPPLVNASREPGSWQTYDIIFNAPKDHADGTQKPATVTVLHNGVLIQNHVAVNKETTAAPLKGFPKSGPIFLQDHGNPVRYRNIWLRPLH
jgi:hypothetical protein